MFLVVTLLTFKKTSVQSGCLNDNIGRIQFYGRDGTSSSRLMDFIEDHIKTLVVMMVCIRFNTMVNTTQTETMVITNGYVGIGTLNPDYKLKIEESTVLMLVWALEISTIQVLVELLLLQFDPDVRVMSFGEGQFFHLSTNDNRVNSEQPIHKHSLKYTIQHNGVVFELRLSIVQHPDLVKNYLVVYN